jgi:hypothetical protein
VLTRPAAVAALLDNAGRSTGGAAQFTVTAPGAWSQIGGPRQ